MGDSHLSACTWQGFGRVFKIRSSLMSPRFVLFYFVLETLGLVLKKKKRKMIAASWVR